MKKYIIAIDGTSGSGKSTLAKYLAGRLGYLYLDTGSMYRALTYVLLKQNIDLRKEKSIIEASKKINLSIKTNKRGVKVYIDKIDVTNKLSLAEVSDNVSRVASIRGVREIMVEQQRKIGVKGGIVIDGRDIGTVVFPKAEMKFYLIADTKERAERRYEELKQKKIKISKHKVKKNLQERDKKDSSREVSPLTPAKDAIIIDTTDMKIKEKDKIVLQYIKEYIQNKK